MMNFSLIGIITSLSSGEKKMVLDMVSPRIAVHNTLITTYGLKRNEYSEDFINIVTLEDLFKK